MPSVSNLLKAIQHPIRRQIMGYIGESLVPTVKFLIGIWFLRLYTKSINYNITDTEVIVTKGVITKTKKIVMYRTVTNMKLKEGLFDKFFNISTVVGRR